MLINILTSLTSLKPLGCICKKIKMRKLLEKVKWQFAHVNEDRIYIEVEYQLQFNSNCHFTLSISLIF